MPQTLTIVEVTNSAANLANVNLTRDDADQVLWFNKGPRGIVIDFWPRPSASTGAFSQNAMVADFWPFKEPPARIVIPSGQTSSAFTIAPKGQGVADHVYGYVIYPTEEFNGGSSGPQAVPQVTAEG